MKRDGIQVQLVRLLLEKKIGIFLHLFAAIMWSNSWKIDVNRFREGN